MTDSNNLCEQIEAVCEKATPGPWHWIDNNTDEPCTPSDLCESEYHEWSLRTVEEFPISMGRTLPEWIIYENEQFNAMEVGKDQYIYPDVEFLAQSRTLLPQAAQLIRELEATVKSFDRSLEVALSKKRELEAENEELKVKKTDWEPGRWWRVIYADRRQYDDGRIAIWCETSAQSEAEEASTRCPGGGILQRIYEHEQSEWREVPASKAYKGEEK